MMVNSTVLNAELLGCMHLHLEDGLPQVCPCVDVLTARKNCFQPCQRLLWKVAHFFHVCQLKQPRPRPTCKPSLIDHLGADAESRVLVWFPGARWLFRSWMLAANVFGRNFLSKILCLHHLSHPRCNLRRCLHLRLKISRSQLRDHRAELAMTGSTSCFDEPNCEILPVSFAAVSIRVL